MQKGTATPSDAELIERCLQKDNAAWEAIVVRFRKIRLLIVRRKHDGDEFFHESVNYLLHHDGTQSSR